MKAIKISTILFSSLLVLGLTSCNSCSSNKQSQDTHAHDDGSVHGNHADEPAKPAAQESFKVEADSTQKAVPLAKEEKHDHSDPNHKH